MTDIEDLKSDELERQSSSSEPASVDRHVSVDKGVREEAHTTLSGSIPGSHTVFVKTWGCSHNVSDSEYMAGLLAKHGYHVVTDASRSEEAHLWLLNSCTVKGPSQDHLMTEVRRARAAKKKLVLAGCVPQGDSTMAVLDGVSVVGVQQIDRVVEVVEHTLNGNSVRLLKQKTRKDETGSSRRKRKDGGAKLNLPKIRRNPLIEICPISTGWYVYVCHRNPFWLCVFSLNTCTYCKTKHARADLGSYATEEILTRLREVREQGVREVWLTSEDTGAYGYVSQPIHLDWILTPTLVNC